MADNPKMVHEEVYEKFDVDPSKLDNSNNPTKSIPHEWYPEIIKYCIENLNLPEPQTSEFRENYSRISFEDKDKAEEFRQKFNENFLNQVNKYIYYIKNDTPRNYVRNITIAMNEDSPIVEMDY